MNSCFRLHSCFTWYQPTQTLCVFPLKPASLFLLAVTPSFLAAWLLFSTPPPPPRSPPPRRSPCLPVWRLAAGVLWLEDQRASERRSPSELNCLCRRRRENLRFHFQTLSSLCNRRERLSHPRTTSSPVQYQRVSHPCYMLIDWARSLLYAAACELRTAECWGVTRRKGSVGAHMHGLIWQRGGEERGAPHCWEMEMVFLSSGPFCAWGVSLKYSRLCSD